MWDGKKGEYLKAIQQYKPLAWSRGWFALRKPGWRPADSEPLLWQVGPDCEDGFFFLPDLPLYLDGSCQCPAEAEIAAAGAAVVQVVNGHVVRRIWFTVPTGFIHSAATGEHLAARFAMIKARPGTVIVVDCASVVSSILHEYRYAADWRRPMAGIWKDMEDYFDKVTVVKTKAHRSKAEAEQAGDLEHFLGNDLADQAAKAAAWEGLQGKEEAEDFVALSARRKGFLRSVASMLALWKPTPKITSREKEPRRRKDKPQHSVQWVSQLNLWQCTVCLRTFRVQERIDKVPCKTGRVVMANLAVRAEALGHQVWSASLVQGQGFILFCNTCGLYAQVRARGLVQPCSGPQGQGSRQE